MQVVLLLSCGMDVVVAQDFIAQDSSTTDSFSNGVLKRRRSEDQTTRSILRPRLSMDHHSHSLEDLEPDPPGVSYPVRTPRISDDSYQASLPELRQEPPDAAAVEEVYVPVTVRCLREEQMKLDELRVWNGSSGRKVEEYLLFCRRLMRQKPLGIMVRQGIVWIEVDGDGGDLASDGNSFKIRPMESDELALKFLDQCNYNYDTAKFLLLSTCGVGCDANKNSAKSQLTRQQRNGGPIVTLDTLRTGSVVWKSWIQEARDSLTRKCSRDNAIDLLSQLKCLSKSGTDQKTVAQANELGSQLETLVVSINEWVAQAHDAASLVKPDLHWTSEEIKDWIDHAPKNTSIKELELFKGLYTECVTLQKDVEVALSGVVDIKVLRKLSDTAKRLPLDTGLLASLERKISDVNSCITEIAKYLPMSHEWTKLPIHMREWTTQPLDKLVALAAEMKQHQVTFKELTMIQDAIDSFNDWHSNVTKALEENAGLKELLRLVKQGDKLPVDVAVDMAPLQESLRRQQECLSKLKTLVPKTGKATRGKPVKGSTKVDLETLIALRDEASYMGIAEDQVQNMNELLEKSMDWRNRANSLFSQMDVTSAETLENLLADGEGIPVSIVPEEDIVGAMLDAKLLIEEMKKSSSGKPDLGILTGFQSRIAHLKQMFQKRVDSEIMKSTESDLKATIQSVREWTERVEILCGVGSHDENKKKKHKKKNKSKKRKVETRIFHAELVDIYHRGQQLPVNVEEHLDLLVELSKNVDELRAVIRDVISRCKNPGLLDEIQHEESLVQQQVTLVEEAPVGEAANEERIPLEDLANEEYEGNMNLVEVPRVELDVEVPSVEEKVHHEIVELSITDLSSIKDSCLSISVISAEEKVLDDALSACTSWISLALSYCSPPGEWSEFPAEEPPSLVTTEMIEEILSSSDSLIVNVDSIAKHLRIVLQVSVAWSHRCERINLCYRTLTEKYSGVDLELKYTSKCYVDPVVKAENPQQEEEEEEEVGRKKRKRSVHNGEENSTVSTGSQERAMDERLDLWPGNEMQFWDKYDSLSTESRTRFPLADDAVEIPIAYLQVEDIQMKRLEVAILPVDIVELLTASMEVAQEMLVDGPTSFAVKLPQVQEVLAIAGVGIWIEEAKRALSHCTKEILRQLVFTSNVILSQDDGEAMEMIEEPFQRILDLVKPNKCQPFVVEMVRFLSCMLRDVAKHTICWNRFAKQKFSAVNQLSELMELRALLEKKSELGLFCEAAMEVRIVQEFNKIREWIDAITPLPTLEDLDDHIARGSKFKVALPQLREMKNASRDAKHWLTALRKTGIEKGEAVMDDLKRLLQDASAIKVDLSDHTKVLRAATRVYCLCHGSFAETMVSCSHCDKWYHIKCIAMSLTNVRKVGRWTCDVCVCERLAKVEEVLARASIARIKYLDEDYSKCIALSEPLLLQQEPPNEEFRNQVLNLMNQDFFKSADGSHMYLALALRIWFHEVKKLFETKKPSVVELKSAYELATVLQLTSIESATQWVQSLLKRSSIWTERANYLFDYPKQVTSEAALVECKSLLALSEYIPVTLAKEKAVASCIDDQAHRYCICHGFSDGTWMINCDHCNKWMHGRCINIDQKMIGDIGTLQCPECAAKAGVPYLYPGQNVQKELIVQQAPFQ